MATTNSLAGLMQSDAGDWQMHVEFDKAERKCRAELLNFADFAAPSYDGIADTMAQALIELDENIRNGQEA